MSRMHLVELHDLAACPPLVRRYLTDVLEGVGNLSPAPYRAFVPRLRAALAATGEHELLDLCSGSGGPLPTLLRLLAADGGPPITARLTDLRPHWTDETRARLAPHGITVHPTPVDATAVPSDLAGFRLICNGFHHFRPDQARAILADAVRCRRGIAIFEAFGRSWAHLLAGALFWLPTLAVTPWLRPFRWSRLLLTYVLPAVPIVASLDGIVSALRVYSPKELRALVAKIEGADTYEWQATRLRVGWLPAHVTVLIGVPRS